MVSPKKNSSAKQRIIETAERLFYAHGLRAVGIDRIIAEAGVAKMTLYNHFASKDDLILAVLEYREGEFAAFLESKMATYVKQGESRIDAFFSTLKEWFESPGFRGCSFINAAVELAEPNHPAAAFAKKHKEQFRQQMVEIITKSVGPSGAKMAPAVSLLVEGAIITSTIDGNPDAAQIACEGAKALIGAAQV
ncbi:MAG: AcrR family transcriptional regulator [Planctomycetota bacterium]|jgi:AcrR family transcriptional regulator